VTQEALRPVLLSWTLRRQRLGETRQVKWTALQRQVICHLVAIDNAEILRECA